VMFRVKTVVSFALVAASTVAMATCIELADEARWSEGVLLHDSAVIVVERQAMREEELIR